MKPHIPILFRIAAWACIGFPAVGPAARAAGPARIAVMPPDAWPLEYTPGEFDLQSRLLILSFIRSIESAPLNDDAALAAYCGRKSVSAVSVSRWKERTYELLAGGFNAARFVPEGSWNSPLARKQVTVPELVSASSSFAESVPPGSAGWLAAARTFTDAYAYEQIRLASLFPKTASEISAFSPDEILGGGFDDKHFTLTFDDGPSAGGGTTDSLIALLRRERIGGRFFVLGETFAKRIDASSVGAVAELYDGMCVDMHGQTHVSHAKSAGWFSSVMQCRSFITQVFPGRAGGVMYFRPPYGQRLDTAAAALKAANCRIMLWNIDTQDWNSSLTNDQIAGRTLALMALWRRGIILFHDVHPKAGAVLPRVMGYARTTGCRWVDCASEVR